MPWNIPLKCDSKKVLVFLHLRYWLLKQYLDSATGYLGTYWLFSTVLYMVILLFSTVLYMVILVFSTVLYMVLLLFSTGLHCALHRTFTFLHCAISGLYHPISRIVDNTADKRVKWRVGGWEGERTSERWLWEDWFSGRSGGGGVMGQASLHTHL